MWTNRNLREVKKCTNVKIFWYKRKKRHDRDLWSERALERSGSRLLSDRTASIKKTNIPVTKFQNSYDESTNSIKTESITRFKISVASNKIDNSLILQHDRV